MEINANVSRFEKMPKMEDPYPADTRANELKTKEFDFTHQGVDPEFNRMSEENSKFFDADKGINRSNYPEMPKFEGSFDLKNLSGSEYLNFEE